MPLLIYAYARARGRTDFVRQTFDFFVSRYSVGVTQFDSLKNFFGNFAARIPEKDIREKVTGVDIRKSCRRFRCWSRRESAWPISEGISAMGGTPGPAPRSMQLSRPSLLSYLQRFNKKRRISYKIDLQLRPRTETSTPRIKEPVKLPHRATRTPAQADGKPQTASITIPRWRDEKRAI